MKTKLVAASLFLSFLVLTLYGETTPRFEVCGDGTVKDHKTGLMWIQNPKLIEEMNWHEGNEHCENLVIGDYIDWRLPTAAEIVFLSEYAEDNSGFLKGKPFSIHKGKSKSANRAIYWGEAISGTHAFVASPIDGWSFRGRYKGWSEEKNKQNTSKYPNQQGYIWPVRSFK